MDGAYGHILTYVYANIRLANIVGGPIILVVHNITPHTAEDIWF